MIQMKWMASLWVIVCCPSNSITYETVVTTTNKYMQLHFCVCQYFFICYYNYVKLVNLYISNSFCYY